MQFQRILNTIFSNFSGAACPQTPLEDLEKFFLPLRGSKKFFRINFPLNGGGGGGGYCMIWRFATTFFWYITEQKLEELDRQKYISLNSS